jgi:hypothetical protein
LIELGAGRFGCYCGELPTVRGADFRPRLFLAGIHRAAL